MCAVPMHTCADSLILVVYSASDENYTPAFGTVTLLHLTRALLLYCAYPIFKILYLGLALTELYNEPAPSCATPRRS